LKKVEMEVMIGGFEDWGWWLVVLWCWGVRGHPGWPKNTKKKVAVAGRGLAVG